MSRGVEYFLFIRVKFCKLLPVFKTQAFMCTVTYIPLKNNNFILTSNRDESPSRIPLAPEYYELNGRKVLFPKDRDAGGTWIGVSEVKRVLCVLNGGFNWHERKSSYRLSRGVLVRELLVCHDIKTSIKNYNFHDIEPFTLVIVDWSNDLVCLELVWDGESPHLRTIEDEPTVWSSSTLFSQAMKVERNKWFEQFVLQNDLEPQDLLRFHMETAPDNKEYGVIMDRGFVKTTSVTQIIKQDEIVSMDFKDLSTGKHTSKHMTYAQSVNE